MLKKLTFLLLCVAFVTIHWSCVKTPDDNKYTDPFPITINVENFVDGNEITWSPIKSADFVSYRIWRMLGQSDTIPNKPSQSTTNNTLITIATITDPEKNSFTDISIGTSTGVQSSYYRVEVTLKNRSVMSRNFLLNVNANNDINEAVKNVKFDKSRNEIYLLSNSGTNLHVFNTQKGEFIKNITIPFSTSLHVEKVNGKNEVYVGSGKKIYVIDIDQGKISEEITLSVNVTITNISSDNNGRLFISTNSSSIIILDRNKKNEIVYNSVDLGGLNQVIVYNIPDENTLLAVEVVSPYNIATLKTNSDKTKIESVENKVSNLGILASSNADVTRNFVLDANTFILSGRGYIYDRKLNNSLGRMLNNSNIPNTTFHFYKDFYGLDKNRYVSISSSSTSFFTIVSWRSPNAVIKEKSVNGFNAIGLAPFGDDIWVALNNFNTGKTSVKKYKY